VFFCAMYVIFYYCNHQVTVQENIICHFRTEPNLTFPRTRTEPNSGSHRTRTPYSDTQQEPEQNRTRAMRVLSHLYYKGMH